MTHPGEPLARTQMSLLEKLRASWFGAFSSVFLARGVGSLATFFTIALLGRTLGRAHYGDLVILLTIMKVASELAGPAMDTALVRFVGTAESSGAQAAPYMRAVLRVKLALSASILIAGALLVWPIQQIIFLREGGALVPLTTLGLAFVGAALAMMYAFVQSSYQARQQFGAYALLKSAARSRGLRRWLRLRCQASPMSPTCSWHTRARPSPSRRSRGSLRRCSQQAATQFPHPFGARSGTSRNG